ncbi:MAG: hypothetical protein GX802_05445 [Clostridiales bacterium]|nr:hypothetical protein [Clostridiales bacterium]
MNVRRRKRRNIVIRPRFWGCLSIFLGLIALGLFFLLRPKAPQTIGYSTVSLDLAVNTTVIRDEVSYETESNYNRVIFYANEGDTLKTGDLVARVFRWGYTDDLMQALYDVQARIILVQQENLKGIATPEIDVINASIITLLDEGVVHINGDGGKSLLQIENELKTLMRQRIDLYNDKTQATEELIRLYKEEEEKTRAVMEWAKDIVSAKGGTISFYFDGNEQALNMEKLDMVTATLISRIQKKPAYVSASSQGAKLYRIIDDSKWCIAFLTKAKEPQRLVENENYSVTFKGYEQTPYQGVADIVKLSESYVLNIIRFEGNMGDFLSIRNVKATIKQDFTGLSVSQKAIIMKDGVAHINVMLNGEKTLVAVEIMGIQNGIAVIRAKGAENLAEGQQVVIP